MVYYQYDASNRRTRKVAETQQGVKVWERIYLGTVEIYRRYAGVNIVEEIESHHVLDGRRRMLLVENVIRRPNAAPGVLYRYQYANHLGSACLELDGAAGVISYEEFHPFGTTAYRATRNATDAPKRYRYIGMERDDETGLACHGARYYVPWLARWCSPDPAGLVDGPQRYAYARNNPVRMTDASGKAGDDEVHPGAFLAAVQLFGTVQPHEDQPGTWLPGIGNSGIPRPLGSISEHGIPGRAFYWFVVSLVGKENYSEEQYKADYNRMPTILIPKGMADTKTYGDNVNITRFVRELTKAGGSPNPLSILRAAKENFLAAAAAHNYPPELALKQFNAQRNFLLMRAGAALLRTGANFGVTAGRTFAGAMIPFFDEIASLTPSGSFFAGLSFLFRQYLPLLGRQLLMSAESLASSAANAAEAAAPVLLEAAAVLAAVASVALAGYEVHAAATGEKGAIATADEAYGTGFSDIYAWQKRSTGARVGLGIATMGLSEGWYQLNKLVEQ
jgi:RHS repeat-associated protein